ncbi:glycosyltransferase family 2 protein [Rosenbergiella epipactidis]|uniref:glycosyltransferase family 2 protein n=1 Tax=Rosenbergiella epipactidis TaxID=1544694 RepID=UPI001F4EC1A5
MKILASLVLFKHSFDDIKETLSALFQEDSISKVIIVDNGEHCAWLDSFVHEKVQIIRVPVNKGFGAGHNVVFERFNGQSDFLLICNPDIHFEKGEVDALYDFSRSEGAGLTVPKIIYPNGNNQYGCKLLPTPYQLFIRRFCSVVTSGVNQRYELRDADYNKTFFAPSLSGCFLLISKDAINIVKGFDEQFFLYMEDVDLSRRVCDTGLPVRYYPGSTVVHVAQSKSYKSLKFLAYHIFSAVKYFNKWGWFLDKKRGKLNSLCLSVLPKSNKED